MRILLIFLLIFFGVNSWSTVAELNNTLSALEAKKVELTKKIKQLDEDLKHNEKNIKSFQKNRDNSETEDSIRNAQEIIDQFEMDKFSIQKQLSSAFLDLSPIPMKIRKLKKKKQIVEKEEFKMHLHTLGLTGDFQGLEIKSMKLDDRIDEMERILDKSAMGVYLKEKMGLLLNSQVICAAQRRCDVPEPKEVSNERITNELFPETQGTTRNQKYYNKANKIYNKSVK